MADRSTFSIKRAAVRGVYWSVARASATDLPRICSSTTPAFRDDTRTNRARANVLMLGLARRRRRGLLGLAVRLERPGQRELTEAVADHVLGHVDGDELLAVVDGERVADELRGDRRAPRPRLEDLLLARAVHLLDAAEQCLVDVRALLQRASHPRLLFLPSRDDPRVRRPRAPSGLVALGRLAPRSHGVIPLPLALAAAHGMVDWVHDRAAHCRPEATPTHAASLADRDVLVVEVAHLTYRGHAVETDEADLTGRQLQRRAAAFLGQELGLGAGASAELGTP